MGVVTAVRGRRAGQGLGTAWPHPPHTHLVLDVERETRERNSEEASRGPPARPSAGACV